MTKEMVWKLEQLKDLFKYVEEAGLEDIVFAILGGIPSRYEEFWTNSKMELQDGRNKSLVLVSVLKSLLPSNLSKTQRQPTI
jgi:hypothetical protein